MQKTIKIKNQFLHKKHAPSFEHKAFLSDALAFFEKKEDALLMDYLYDYTDNAKINSHSTALWSKYYKYKDYYLPSAEKEAINLYAPHISKIIGEDVDFIDLGPGSIDAVKEKTLPVLKVTKGIKSYTSFDISEKFSNESAKFIQKKFPNTKTHHIQGNFYDPSRPLPSVKNRVGLFFGCTSGNIAEHMHSWMPINTINNLARIKHSLIGKSGYLVISQDTTQEQSILQKAYDHDVAKSFRLRVLHRIKSQLFPAGFDPEGFECVCRWQSRQNFFGSYARAIKDQSFVLGGKMINVQEGDEFNLCRSYKYSLEQFKEIGRLAGYQPVAVFKDSSDRMAIHVWKC